MKRETDEGRRRREQLRQGREQLRQGREQLVQKVTGPVELRDDETKVHEIGRRTYIVADVEPLDVDGVRTVQVGTAVWLVGFLALLPFWSSLAENDRTWWLWTCLTGLGLGLVGLEYCVRRKRTRALLREDDEGTQDPAGPDPAGSGA